MEGTIRKIKHIVPSRPRRIFNIVSGTTRFADVLLALRLMFVNDSRLSKSNYVKEYESKLCGITGTKYVVSFGAGRMALYAILKSMGVGPGDEVIVPGYTCVVVPNSIIYVGAKPIYVDIDRETFNVDVSKIEQEINENTKVIYAQHTYGMPCEMKKIKKLAEKYGLLVIEDAAHALGGSYNGEKIGSLGDASFFSSDHTKTIGTHVGGIAATNDKKLAIRLKKIHDESSVIPDSKIRKILFSFLLEYFIFSPYLYWIGKPIHVILIKIGALFYHSDELMLEKPSLYPSMLSFSQARLGLSQLKYFENNVSARREIFFLIDSILHKYDQHQEIVKNSVMLRYSFLVNDRFEFEKRFSDNFDLGVWFTTVVHGRNEDFYKVGYVNGSCPVAEFVASHVVNFPTHQRISATAIENMIIANEDWIRKNLI